MVSERKQKVRVGVLIVSLLIPLAVGIFSAFLTSSDMESYEVFNKPLLAPPGWVFPIAWTILYILMGVASYLVYTSDADPVIKRKALTFYAAQLILNFFWSTLFFTYCVYLISLIWLLAMWLLVLICIIKFYQISRPASYMMVPLFLWSTFAAYLNLAYFIMRGRPMPL